MDNIEFSTDEFAREMNMSRSNLHLKLKAITGESTIDFIRKIRFNEAAKVTQGWSLHDSRGQHNGRFQYAVLFCYEFQEVFRMFTHGVY